MAQTVDAQAAETTKPTRKWFDFPSNCYSAPKANSIDGGEFVNIRMPEGFTINGLDIDGNDLSGRDLGAEGFRTTQNFRNADGQKFIHDSNFIEGGRRFSQTQDYPVTLTRSVRDEETGEWSVAETVKVDVDTFDAAVKDWQYAKDEDGRNINLMTMQVPREMAHRVETKDGSVFYNIDCPETTVAKWAPRDGQPKPESVDVTGRQITVSRVREVPWDKEGAVYGIDAFKDSQLRAVDPSDRGDAVYVSTPHLNMAYRTEVNKAQKAKADAPAHGKHVANDAPAHARTVTQDAPNMQNPVPKAATPSR